MRSRDRSLLAWLREREAGLILLAGLTIFGLAVAGYARDESLPDAIYHSLQLFTLSFEGPDSSWEVRLARFLAPGIGALAGLKALVTIFDAEFEGARVRRSRDHVVICGLGRRGLRLVEGFTEGGDRVVAIERDPDAPAISAARLRGALVVVGDARDPALLRRARVERSRAVVAVCPDDDVNVEIATEVDRLSSARGHSSPAMFVHVGEEELWRGLRERAVREASVARSGAEFFNVFDRGARALLRRHPLADGEAPSPPHLVVVGLGRMGAALVVAAARLWDALGMWDGQRLRLTVVDPQAHAHLGRLCLRYPHLERDCDVVAVDAEVGTPAFEAARFLLDESAVAVTQVYVCLEDEVAALSAGLTLRRRLERDSVPVVIQVASEPDSMGRFLAGGQTPGQAGRLVLFGLIEQTCTPELLVENTTETIARALHERWFREQVEAGFTVADKPTLRPWEELPGEVREDNRSQARDIGAKLAAVGCDIGLLDDWGASLTALTPDEVERLAEMEHERWMTARLQAGWQPGPRDDAARRHPDILPWAELSEDIREIDRFFVREIPVLLARAGFQIRRTGGPPESQT